jgi:F-type H+-transporting ATPase subunit epsilon
MMLEIVTPDQKVFSGEVKLVQVPGTLGSFEILQNHAPIISSLTLGKVKIITSDGTQQFFTIDGGVIEVKDNHIILLAESLQK